MKEKLPIPEHRLWSWLYTVANNSDSEYAHNLLEQCRDNIPISSELETSIRRGDYGVRMKGVLLMALQTADRITDEEKKFIFDNFDKIK